MDNLQTKLPMMNGSGNVRRSAHIVSSGAGAAGPSNTVGSGASLASDSDNQNLTAEYRALMSECSNKLHVLDAFNGQYFSTCWTKRSYAQCQSWF